MITIDEFKNKITKKSRLLGLDLGSKRIGVAICDDHQSIATPFRTINKESSGQFINELKLIIKETPHGQTQITDPHRGRAQADGYHLAPGAGDGKRCGRRLAQRREAGL